MAMAVNSNEQTRGIFCGKQQGKKHAQGCHVSGGGDYSNVDNVRNYVHSSRGFEKLCA
jgi:hypothetical protein